jgi:hypothetical protein
LQDLLIKLYSYFRTGHTLQTGIAYTKNFRSDLPDEMRPYQK